MTAHDLDNMIVLHSDFLRPYAVTLTKDHEEAKDLFQETIMRALLNREKYQFGTNLKAWLYTIMRNIFINKYRRNKKFRKVENATMTELPVYTVDTTVHNEGWSMLRMQEIKNAIDTLPRSSRISFELHYTGYKYQEIAKLMNEPLGTIKSRIHFARKSLTSMLDR